jgi:hypothetical protein
MGIMSFAFITVILALLALARCRTTIVEAILVATAAATVNLVFDIRMIQSPPRPRDILFYGVGDFLLSWVVGFAIAIVIGLFARRLRPPAR